MATAYFAKRIFGKGLSLENCDLRRHCHNRWRSTLAKLEDDDQYIVRSPLPDEEIPLGVTVPEYLQATMGNWGDKTAYESMSGEKLTYNELFRQSKGLAAALIQAGFKRGDVIGICLQNIPQYASVQFGIWEAGLIASPINPNYTPDEIRRQLKISGAKGVVSSTQFISAIKQAQANQASELSPGNFIVCIGAKMEGCHSYDDMVKTNPSHVKFPRVTQESCLEDTALLPFSSGTTGPPKGVCLTHYNLLANLVQVANPQLDHMPRLGNEQQRRYIGILPFFHAYGLMVSLSSALYRGAHTLCIPKFESNIFLEAIRRHRPTELHLVPPLVSLINTSDEYGPKELEAVELILIGAAPVGRSMILSLMEKKGKEFYFLEGYGMTELSPVSHLMRPSLKNPVIGSCGIPLPNTLTKVIDPDTGKPLGRNIRGELLVKGPQVMKGYFNNEEATRHTIDNDGWLHTGDIAYNDEDGNCFIVDRIKELIKVKGFQVAPSELEDCLRNHEKVSDVAVIGVPHKDYGEAPRAYIVRACDSLTTDDIHRHLEPQISSFKQLKGGIEFVKSIPRAPSGKLLRRELLADYKKSVSN